MGQLNMSKTKASVQPIQLVILANTAFCFSTYPGVSSHFSRRSLGRRRSLLYMVYFNDFITFSLHINLNFWLATMLLGMF